jgi:hypothetical protein
LAFIADPGTAPPKRVAQMPGLRNKCSRLFAHGRCKDFINRSPSLRNFVVQGSRFFPSTQAKATVTIRAKSVILCTGAGGFKPNGFPLGDLTHDCMIMAYEIGAKVTGKQ